MDAEGHQPLRPASIFFCGTLWTLILCACAGQPATPTVVSLPTASATVMPLLPSSSAIPAIPTPTPPCADGLSFLDDVTIPDYTVVAPSSSLDKQWLVQNSGSCNWDSRYRLRLISGEALGASPEQALYPARAGMQATLRIFFTAPQEAGEYVSEWQAYNPQGQAFGETVFIKIVVQP
jgi:hypothetical protein